MPDTLKLEIVTPDARTFSDDVEMVTLPGIEGEMGVYPQHVPLMTQLCRAKSSCARTARTLSGRRRRICRNHRRSCRRPDRHGHPGRQIDEAKAEEARRRAEARLAEQLDDEETATVHAALANSIAQLAVKRRRNR